MQIARLPARAGLRWIADGFRILRRQPVALLAVSFLNLLLMGLSVVIPIIGAFGPLLLTPVLMVGMMQAAREADAGRTPSPAALFAGFREQQGRAWKPLLALGVINAVATVIALAASGWVAGDALIDLATGRIGPDDPRANDDALIAAALLFMAIYLPVQLATWYAPLFIAWDRVPVVKSLFFSIAAILRNKGAFLMYAAGWVAIAMIAALLIRALQGVLTETPLLMSMLFTPLWLVGITGLYCSFWVTYRDAVDRGPGMRVSVQA